ncbi:MAG: YcxB family protein [Flavobacterium sp.]|nr:YcxB family protein [Flavobacterium sp.]
MRALLGLSLLLILWIVFHYVGLLDLPEPTIYQYITLALIVVIQPAGIFTLIYRNYHSSNHLRETLTMNLNDEAIEITGESFLMKVYWDRMYKIVEHAKWFLIYQNNFSAIIIPKASLTSEQEIELRQILQNVTNVPTTLNKVSRM